MRYLLAHDLGTSGDKATLFSVDGMLVDSRTRSYPLYQNSLLLAEQDPDDWWKAVCDTTKELIKATGILPGEIEAVSFSGQMMGCLPVDGRGRPLRRSIIWADRRAQAQSDRLSEEIKAKDFYNIVGHRNTASYGVQKTMWVRDNEPEVYDEARYFLNAKDYIVFRLTGRFATDPSDANSMGCFDLKKLDWSEEILNAAGIDIDRLPQIVPSTECIGNVTDEASLETGLSVKTKVIMGAGDGVAANVGAGSIAPGKAYCCLGTSAWVASTSVEPVLDPEMRIVCWAHAVPGLYSPNGTMQYACGSYSWFKNVIGVSETEEAGRLGISPYELLNSEAEKSMPGADGVIFLPYLMGERAPRWNPLAKGAYLGLTAATSRNDLVRATLEGISANLSLCLDILNRNGDIAEMTVIGGGARGEIWCRILADLFDMPVRVPVSLEEAGSMGAALIAGVGAGVYEDFNEIERFLKTDKIMEPEHENSKVYEKLKKEFDLYYRALEPLFR